ncbi:MAG TPA: hypothetical protein VFB81_23985, partial [Myxococcales bacterium]|nr:hypothetical protein [Myxococcales bacterium]
KLGLNGAGLSTMALAGAAYSGGTSLLEQARDPNGQGIDGGRLLFDTGIGGLSSFAGGYAGRLPGLAPGMAGNVLRSPTGGFAFDRGVDLVTGAGFNALDQYATTGQVDLGGAMRAGLDNTILGGLDHAAQQGLQSRMPRPGAPVDPAAPAGPTVPRAPLTPEETQHAADLLMTIARRTQLQQSQQELMGPFTPWGTAGELQRTRGEVALLNQQLGTVGMDPSTPAGREALRSYLGGASPETDALLGALDRLPGDKPWTPRMDLPAGAPTEDAVRQAQIDALKNANAAYDRWAVDQIARGNFDVQPLVDNLGRQAGLAQQRLAEQGYDPAQHPQGAFVPPGTVQPRSASERGEIDLQTGALLDIGARRLEILQQQREALGVRAPSALDVQIADEIANIERNRVQREAIGAPLPPHLQQQFAGLPRGADAFAPWHQEMMASRLDGVQNPEEVAHQLAMYELYRRHQAFYQGLPGQVTQALSSGSLPPPAPSTPPTPRSPMSRQFGLPVQTRMVQMQQEVRNLLRVAQASR